MSGPTTPGPVPGGASPTVLGGRYVLEEAIGSGASATVYAARDVTAPDGPALAVKVLHPQVAADARARIRLHDEARAGARVQHPGLVRVLDVGEDGVDGRAVAWLAMTRAPGVPLADAVHAGGLALPVALDVAAQLLDALAAAHDAGLVHRDVSAGNVLVDVRGGAVVVTLLDLGLAEPSTRPSAPRAGLVAGSVHAMAPEQAQGLPVGPSADLYAVGALLYLMATGRPPYEADDPRDVLAAHVWAPVPVPSARRPGLPVAVDRVVVRALAKSPQARYASATRMAAAVRAARADLDAAVGQPGGLGPPVPLDAARRGPGGTRVLPGVARPAAPPPRAVPTTARLGPGAVTLLAVCGLAAVGLMWSVARADDVAAPPTVTAAPPSPAPTPSTDDSSPPAPSPVRVPVVVGLDLADASRALRAAGLAVGDVRERDVVAPAGRVLESDPPAGRWVRAGAAVTLEVATGLVPVPDVTGLTADDAVAALAATGLTGALAARTDPVVPVGALVGTDPPAGTRLPLGATVVVVRSDGPPAPTATPAPSPTSPAPEPTPTATGTDPPAEDSG